MIRLTYAHRWTALTDALAERIHTARKIQSPLDPLTIVIPHPIAGAFLKLALADRIGISGNLRMTYLRPLVVQAYERGGDRRLFTPARLQHLLLAVLQRVEGESLAPIRRYLEQDGPIDRRRAQLASALACLFDEYLLTRPEMLAGWMAQDSAPSDETSAWQAALWRQLRTEADQLEGPPLSTLDEVMAAPADVPPILLVFDVQLGAPVLQGVLARWASTVDIEVYATNPCMEFWEDLPAGGSAARDLRARLAPRTRGGWSDLADADDPLALILWGRPGRENVRYLNQLTDCDFDGRFGPLADEPTTVLARLQRDILHRVPPRPADGSATDDSIQFVACPGARREAEVIVESIWAQVSNSVGSGAPLGFSDIGIILAGRDADAYRSHFAAVFEEYHQVPHHFLEVPVARGSRVVEAFELLLDLPTSRFTRQDMLRLVTHPNVIPDDPEISATEWSGWCEDLAIVHGADRADHADTYIDNDLLNWNQGLFRLTLGQFMASDDDGPVFYRGAQSAYLPHDIALDRGDSAARFVTLVRSVINDARFLAGATLSVREWVALLRVAVAAYISPRDDGDERDLLRVLSLLDDLELDDLTQVPVRFPVMQEVLRSALNDLTENVGQPLADGVVVAPLRLAASLPLRVVYLPGLHEGAFPVPELNSSLDVRRFERRPGEIAPRERDQYNFLSRLLATEDRVCLSYVARDAATGEARAPAPTLVELTRIIAPYFGGHPERLIARPALRRYADASPRFASPAAAREAETWRVRRALAARVGADVLDPETVRRMLGPSAWRRLEAQIRIAELPSDPVELPTTVTLRALRVFLEDPLQGWAHHALGLRSDEDDDRSMSVTDERFQTERLPAFMLLRTVLLESVRDRAAIEDVYARHADRLEVFGVVPTGVFKRSDRDRHLKVLEGWSRGLRRVFMNRPRAFDPIRFGRGAAPVEGAVSAPAFPIPLSTGAVELRGTTQPAIESPPGAVVLKVEGRPMSGPPTHELAGFIDQVARSAAGQIAGQPFTVWTVYGDGQTVRTRFEPFGQQEAEAYLTHLTTELQTEAHDYLLPFSAVDRAFLKGDGSEEGWAPILDAVRPAEYGPLHGVAAPVCNPVRAQRILTDRFGPFYRRRREDLGA